MRYGSFIPVIVMMVMIFLFSAKPAVESNETSTPIAKALVNIWDSFFGFKNEIQRLDWLNYANFIVRKTAHVTEYLLLAICMSWPLWMRMFRRRKLVGTAILCSVLYAITDEFHQLFIEGRSGSLKDVGIDSIGCIIGSLLFLVVASRVEGRKKRKFS